MTTFEDILDQPLHEVERPLPLPVGTYQWIVQGQPRLDKSPKKQTPFVEFTMVCQGPQEDVDETALEEFGGRAAVSGVKRRLTFYYNQEDPKSIWRLDDFLKNVLLHESGLKRNQMLAESNGRSFLAMVRHNPTQDGTRIVDEVYNPSAL